jgi:hypothetical protein
MKVEGILNHIMSQVWTMFKYFDVINFLNFSFKKMSFFNKDVINVW